MLFPTPLKLDAKTLMTPSWTEPSPEPPAPPLDAAEEELNSPLPALISGSSMAVPIACAAVVMNVDAASAPAEQPSAHTPTIHCDARIMSFAFPGDRETCGARVLYPAHIDASKQVLVRTWKKTGIAGPRSG